MKGHDWKGSGLRVKGFLLSKKGKPSFRNGIYIYWRWEEMFGGGGGGGCWGFWVVLGKKGPGARKRGPKKRNPFFLLMRRSQRNLYQGKSDRVKRIRSEHVARVRSALGKARNKTS